MKIEYKGLDGNFYSEVLEEINVTGLLLHSTPDYNISNIKSKGLKTKMPRNKLLVKINAIFCTVPSETPNTNDLFRYYDDWSIVIIDTDKIPNHKWYVDLFAVQDPSNNGNNKHVMTFEDIPAAAIKKIIK